MGRLLTDQQHADHQAERKWKLGDRARYVGEDRLEKSSRGTHIPRPHGQLAHVSKVLRKPSGTQVVWFMPDPPKEYNAIDVEVCELVTTEGGKNWFDFERIPG